MQAFILPPVGHYDHSNVLIKQINNAIAKVELFALSAQFSLNEISRKIAITSDKKTIGMASLKMSKGFAKLLEFEYSIFDEIILQIKKSIYR